METSIPTLYLMVGLPGSGKSTYVKKLQKEHPDAYLCSSDILRADLLGDEEDQSHNGDIIQLCRSLIAAKLYEGVDVIYDATNIRRSHRAQVLKMLTLIPCMKICCYVKADLKTCLKNNAKRERHVPTSVIQRMHNEFESPLDISPYTNRPFEKWDKVKVITATGDEEE